MEHRISAASSKAWRANIINIKRQARQISIIEQHRKNIVAAHHASAAASFVARRIARNISGI